MILKKLGFNMISKLTVTIALSVTSAFNLINDNNFLTFAKETKNEGFTQEEQLGLSEVESLMGDDQVFSNDTFKIPDRYKKICDDAFRDCKNIKKVIIPETITYIGRRAFWGCNKLEEITIPSGVTSIKEYTFCGCENLRLVYFLEGVNGSQIRDIETGAFKFCVNLGNECVFTVPSAVNRIGNGAFEFCSRLTKVVLNPGLQRIGYKAFARCENLGRGVKFYIPSTVTVIERYAFDGCHSLRDVTFSGSSKLKSICSCAFLGCSNLGKDIKFSIPQSVVTIGKSAFEGCNCLYNVSFSNKDENSQVNKICDDTFSCSGLKVFKVPDSVESIGKRAFWCCHNLTGVVVPVKTDKLMKACFWGCDNLISIEFLRDSSTIKEECFLGCEKLLVVSFPNANNVTIEKNVFNKVNKDFSLFIQPGGKIEQENT